MLTLPDCIVAILASFAPLFSTPVFRHVQILVTGAILTPGRHTVTNALRVMGLSQTHRFQNFHRVLNRAKWNSRRAAKVLLDLLITAFVPEGGEVLIGIDETLERRRGKKIAAKGIYRDAARSSKSFFVKSTGLRWVCMMLLVSIGWADCVWALPFFSVLAPSERYNKERGRRHKTLVDWARQMVIQVHRWLPDRRIVLVGDNNYSAIPLLDCCNRCRRSQMPVTPVTPVTVVTRLRLDAALFEPAPERVPGQVGRPRKSGERLPTLQKILNDAATVWSTIVVPIWYSEKDRKVEIVSATCLWFHRGQPPVPIRYVLIRDPDKKFDPQALLCTDLAAEPVQILSWFVRRWRLEETFQEVRTHLGVETQRQWNDLAILRTTPALMGLFSFVTLVADRLAAQGKLSVRTAAWYAKEQVTFSDAIACVRREIWRRRFFGRFLCMSPGTGDMPKLSYDLFAAMEEVLCYPA
jgi:hypothetical protein